MAAFLPHHTSAFVPGCKPATTVPLNVYPALSRPSNNPMKIRKAVFPVAGLGTRVLPATKAMPKEMLTIVDKPLIQYVVDEAKEAGIEHFVFVTGRNKGVIEDHFDRMFELDTTLAARGNKKTEQDILARDQPEAGATSFTRQQAPLGLGHAVWCARDIVGDEPFAVILAEHFPSDRQCLPVQRFGTLILSFILVNTTEFSQRNRDVLVLWSERLSTDLKRFFEPSPRSGATIRSEVRP